MAMRIFSRLVPCVLALWLGRQAMPADDAAAVRASQVWEEAIKAKGGRERIRSISNFVRSSTSRWGFMGFNDFTVSYETLLVLPSKMWDWIDERPSKFGLQLMIVDLEQDYHQLIYDGMDSPLARGRPNVGDISRIRELQILTFMETQWVQPEVRRAEDKLWNLRRVTVVETQLGDQGFDFYLDRQTRLPLRVLIKTPTKIRIHETDCRLGEYSDVEGLQLPHDVSCKEQDMPRPPREKVRYRLNVEYDKELFRRPPSLDRGPKGWQPWKAEGL